MADQEALIDAPPVAARATAAGGHRLDLTEGAILPKLIAFGLPTLGSNILQSLNGTMNTVWVGHLMGENALAATGNVNTIMFICFAALFGFGMATTILVGQSMGRRDIDMLRRVIGTSAGMFLALSIVIAFAGWFAAPGLLHLLATPAEALPYATGYFRIIFLAMPAIFMFMLAMMGLRGSGDSQTPLIWMAVSVVLDSGLNPFLIAGIGPFPKMGTEGAALATVIANYVSLVGLLVMIYKQDLLIRLRGKEFSYLKPDPVLLRTIITKGFPMAVQMFMLSASGVLVMGLVNREGVQIAAAANVTGQVFNYAIMPAMAIGAAVSTMVSQNIGANKWDRVDEIASTGLRVVVGVTATMILILTVLDKPALSLFVGWNSPTMPIAQHIMLLNGWGFVLFAITFVTLGVMRANGAVWAGIVILTIAMLPARIGLIFLLRPLIGADGLWWSGSLSSGVAAAMAMAYYRSGRWRKARMMPA
jgi:putative MATE family efflux protein